MQSDTLELCAIKFCFKLGKNASKTYGMPQTTFRPFCMNRASVSERHKRFKEGRESVRNDERCWGSKEVNKPELIGQRVRVEVLREFRKRFYVEVLREFRKRFRWKRPALFKSGQWHFHQDNTPVHNSILVTDYLIKMGIKTVPHLLYSLDFALCDFWLFPKLSLWDNWDERGCDEYHWHAHTRGLSRGLPEVVGTVQKVDCSRRRLLRRELKFHVCTINKSAHTKKVWKPILCTS